MSDCFVLYLLLICMKKEKTGAGKFTNNIKNHQVAAELLEIALGVTSDS